MKKILLVVAVISAVSGLSFQALGKGRANNHEPVYVAPFITSTGVPLAICGYRPAKNVEAQRKNGVLGKAYNDPQGDEGIEVAFSPFLALTPACLVNLGDLGSFGDADPLPHED